MHVANAFHEVIIQHGLGQQDGICGVHGGILLVERPQQCQLRHADQPNGKNTHGNRQDDEHRPRTVDPQIAIDFDPARHAWTFELRELFLEIRFPISLFRYPPFTSFTISPSAICS